MTTLAEVILRDTRANQPAAGSTAAGALYYVTDESVTERCTGSAWEDVSDAGSAGAVATDAIWDAKGDLAGGTGANTASKLVVGADDTVLTADAAQATGMKWAAAASGAFVGVKAYNSVVQSIVHNTETALTFDSEDHDSDTLHSTASDTSRLTADRTGYWRVWANAYVAANATGYRFIRFRQNGTTDISGRSGDISASGSFGAMIHAVTEVYLTSTQYVEVLGYQSSGGNLDFGHGSARSIQCEFGMSLIGT